MQRKYMAAVAVAVILGLTAGCAPGDISRLSARAQQAGEALFEGGTAPAVNVSDAAEVAESSTVTQTEQETGRTAAENTGEEESVAVTASGSAEDREPESPEAEQTESITAEGGQTQSAQEAGGDEPLEEADESAALEAVMAAATQSVRDAIDKNTDGFPVSLAGRDKLTGAERKAIGAVFSERTTDGDTACLLTSARPDGRTEGTFLLFFDTDMLTARGKIRGDLWFYDGQRAVRLLEEARFLEFRLLKSNGIPLILAGVEEEGGKKACVWYMKDGGVSPCFNGAAEVKQAGNELCVSYPSTHFRYDPMIREWEGALDTAPYFYRMEKDGPRQLEAVMITQEEYLNAFPDSEEGKRLRARQEEKFANGIEEERQYRYTFFRIGDNRPGYRECTVGIPDGDEIDHAVAEYRYTVYDAPGGRLNFHDPLTGKEFYFMDRDAQEEELTALNQLPAAYKDNRIKRAKESLGAPAGQALKTVLKAKEYGQEEICFVYTGDFDGDGDREAFVLAGTYDGAFGAPVCDLWYVAEGTAQLQEENQPIKEAGLYTGNASRLFLIEGYRAADAKDRLYTVTDGSVRRIIEGADKIDIMENGDIRAFISDGEGGRSYDYHMVNGQETVYPAEEMNAAELKGFKNGAAVYNRLLGLADSDAARISCLRRENQVIHVMLSEAYGDKTAVSYENYELHDGYLVLTESGRGGYTAEP